MINNTLHKKELIWILLLAAAILFTPVTVRAESVSENEIPDEFYDIGTPVLDEDYVEPDLTLADESIEDILSEEDAADFIERLYNVALGRASEEKGKQDWIDSLNKGSTGADLAKGFLYSQEFLNKGTDNNTFVTVLYRTFFDREPDEKGKADWIKALESGTPRQQIVDGFINSQEYANLCLSYRIDPGTGVKPNIKVEPSQQVVDFTERLYSICLDRTSDEEGLKNWSNVLGNMESSGTQVAYGFFFSSEFTNKNTPNADFIFRLYRTFFNREPDTAGFNNWMRVLNNGASREEVFNGFAQSTEFKQLCAAAGIIPGNEKYAGTTRVVTNNASKTWVKETVDTGRRRTSPIYEQYVREWCNTCGKEFNMYDPNNKYPQITHLEETGHHGTSWTIGEIQVGTFQERILETHERCLETGEIRNRNTFWEEGGARYRDRVPAY